MLAIRWGVVAGVAALALVGMVAGRWGGDGAGMPGGAGAGFKPAPNGSGSLSEAAGVDQAAGGDPRAAARMAFVPALLPFDASVACTAAVTVQNVGAEPSKATIITWDAEPDACPPQCRGPLKVECSGLIMPGAVWTFARGQLPTRSAGGLVVSFNVRKLSEIGVDLGFDDIVADAMCEALFFGVVGDCDDYRRFLKAFAAGDAFQGIPQAEARGAPMAVEVVRDCPHPAGDGRTGRASYAGVNGHALGAADAAGGFTAFAPAVRVGRAGERTLLRVQNAGTECASVDVVFRPAGACDAPRATPCAVEAIPPGVTRVVDLSACVAASETAGTVTVRGTQPLAVVVDAWAGDALMSYAALPGADGAPGGAISARPSTTAIAPLVYQAFEGWTTRIHVQNVSLVDPAQVKASFQDRGGDVVATHTQVVCPGGGAVFDLAGVDDLPGGWVGSALVQSLALPQSGRPDPEIRGVAELIRATDAVPVSEGVMAPLVTEATGFDAPTGGAGLIAVSRLVKLAGGADGPTTALAIHNLVTRPGFTDFAIYLYDQNGLLDFTCQKLHQRQVEYIDLATWGFVNAGFVGSAVISAEHWEHDVFSPTGAFVKRLVGLGAVVIERPFASRGGPGQPAVDHDRPGDVSAGGLGQAFFAIDGARAGVIPAGAGLRCPGRPAQASATPAATRRATATARPTLPPTAGPSPTPEPPPVARDARLPVGRAASRLAYLPGMTVFAGSLACQTVLAVQSMGADRSKAVLVTWDAEGDACPPQCRGPLKVECSGLLAPGRTWNFVGSQIPTGSASGLVVSYTARTLAELGLADDLGFDDVAADFMCETLFFGIVGDCDDYRRFLTAYHSGSAFGGVPQARIYGAPLAVNVTRRCPNPTDGNLTGRADYTGVNGYDLGAADAAGAFRYHLPAASGARERPTLIRVQNAGAECATVEVWYRAPDRCNEPRRCARLALAPGAAERVDLTSCVGPDDTDGAAWVDGDQPLAVMADTWAGDALSSYAALPARRLDNATGAPLLGPDSATAYAPLVYRQLGGWSSRLHVQNGSRDTEAEVKVYFVDRSGDVVTTVVQRVCPGGSQVVDLAGVGGLPDSWLGSAIVESQAWWTPGAGRVTPPDVFGVVEATRRTADTVTSEGFFAPMIAESTGFDAPDGGSGGLAGGVGLVAIPGLVKDRDGRGGMSEMAIQNLVAKPGFTDLALYLYDQNGLLDFVCLKLHARQTEYIDLATWGFVNAGFAGSAVISAGFWEHDVFSPSGAFVKNLVGLGAMTAERPAWSPAVDADTPGDVSVGGLGVPFYPADGADAVAAVDFAGLLCPGWSAPRRETPTPTAVVTRPPRASATPTPLPTDGPSPTPRPTLAAADDLPVPAAPPVHLPALQAIGADAVCRSDLSIQSLGTEPSKAVAVFWGARGACGPGCAAPLKVVCTGLLRPGGAWLMAAGDIPPTAHGGVVFSFTARRASEVGIDLGGPDDVVADAMCERLLFGVGADCAAYGAFKAAYHRGAAWGGVPLDRAAGAPLAVDVQRVCPGDVSPGVAAGAGYRGVTELSPFDPLAGGHVAHAPLVQAGMAGLDSTVYLQNAGSQCASVEVWFKAQDDCLHARICDILTLAPGESHPLHAADCVGPGWQGSAWIRASGPLAVTVDTAGRDTLTTYEGVLPPVVRADPVRPGDSPSSTYSRVAYGPLFYSEYQGWDTGVQVMNLSQVHNAKVKVYFYDRSGDIITTLVDWVCPRGSQTFFLPVAARIPGSWAGSVRAVSLPWWTPDEPAETSPAIAGIVTLLKYSDEQRTEVVSAAAYAMLGEHEGFVAGEYGDGTTGVGAGDGGLASGIGLVAVPRVGRTAAAAGRHTELAVTNLVHKRGHTDYAVYLVDANGWVDTVCQRIHAGQVDYIDLAGWGHLGAAFVGSALVSATGWHHDVVSATGRYVRSVVGLAATAVQRHGAVLDFGRSDAPGDELSISTGVPLGPAAASALAPVLGDPGCPPDTSAAPPSAWPRSDGPPEVHLAALTGLGSATACEAFVDVVNPTAAAGKAVLLAWGAPGACGPGCDGPAAVACSGLLRGGGTWRLAAPAGARSGVLYSFTGRTTADIGVARPMPAVVADVLCDALTADVRGSCGGFQAFQAAYRSGGTFAGIPLARAYGGPLLAEVRRGCDAGGGAVGTVWSTYGGATTADLGAAAAGPDGVPGSAPGAYVYGLPVVQAGAGPTGQVYVQNAGTACADVELWFADREACRAARRCASVAVAPGQARALAVAEACAAPDGALPASGLGWVSSTQPAAVVVDGLSGPAGAAGGLTTYAAPPHARAGSDPAAPGGGMRPGGSTVLVGPLAYNALQGWAQAVHVLNLSGDTQAKVKVTFVDRTGDIGASFVEWLCPAGAAAVAVPAIGELPGNWVGSVRVESVPYRRPGDEAWVAPPAIAGVVEQAAIRVEAAGPRAAAAAAYALLAEEAAFDWPDGGAGGPAGGVGMIAVPSLQKPAADAAGATTEVAVANLAQAPGFTDLALFLFDANGLVDHVCEKLHDRTAVYIDAATWGFVAPGFAGSMVISAVYWQHPATRADGAAVNQLGLGAVVAQRTGTVLGEDAPGDELGLAAAVPLRGDLARAVAATLGGPVACPRSAATPTPADPPTPAPTATPPPTAPDPTATPADPPTRRPPPTAAPPEGTPTAAATPTPVGRPPTAAPSPAPSATATAGALVEVKVCPGLERRVPDGVLRERLAHPETLGGWGQRCNPALPASPFNGYRASLRLQNPARAYQPMFNDLVLGCGCR